MTTAIFYQQMKLDILLVLKVVELVPIHYFKFRILLLFEKNTGFAVLSVLQTRVTCTSHNVNTSCLGDRLRKTRADFLQETAPHTGFEK